ncbi:MULTISPECIES: TRAP transporter substrate-binding protein [Savagea]|uniref:TRAP transporter substrate-binding protein n=2 Tax=Savagea TaxID=1655429 RepID=A0A8J7G742_9BACL|nr:TRAP transporter substrate-binding protein [Savagea serpentis]MBF4501556.1 TRAP transporter substrate-binding protein [Savagea serpentis]
MKNTLQKFKVLLLVTVLMTVLAACSDKEGAEGAEGEVIKIRMANQVDEGNFLNQGYVKFKEVLEEKGKGQFAVEIYNGGTLVGSDDGIVEALKSGSIEISTSSAYGTANTTGVNGFKLFDMPLLIDNRESFYNLLDGEFGEGLKEEVAKNNNLKVLGFIDLGFYSILNGKKDVSTPADLKGLKIRSSAADLHLDSLAAMGANPTPLSYTEVFTGLQQGAIDGVSTTTPLIYGDRFFEINKHLTLTNHVLLPHVLMINGDLYERLTDEQKSILEEATAEYIKYARELSIEAEKEAVEGMKAEGVTVTELTEDQKEEFKKVVAPVIDKHINEIGKDVYDKAIEELNK